MIDSLATEVGMVQRHLYILQMVIENQPIGIVKMSNETGYPHHKVRYSLRMLEQQHLIEPSKQGAVTTSQPSEFVETHTKKVDEIREQLDRMRIES